MWIMIPKQSLAWWGLRILLVTIPATIGGVYSYRSSKVEAEAGYKTLVTRVVELEKVQDELVKDLAFLRGEVESNMQRAGEPLAPRPPAKRSPRQAIPRNLEDAVRQKMF